MSPHSPVKFSCIQPAVLFLLSFLTIGCQSAGYRADRLPSEYRASSARSTNSMNLAQVASDGISNATLSPADLLEINVNSGNADEKSKPILVRVSDNGTVDIPVIGSVTVAGLEEYEAGKSISEMAVQRGMYHHPIVTVQIKSKAVNRITVLGAVKRPGVHEIARGGCDLLTTIAAAGGLSDSAGTEVEIIRQAETFHAQNQQLNPAPNDINKDPNEVQLASYQNMGQIQSYPKPTSINPQMQRIDLAKLNSPASRQYKLSDRDIVRVISRNKQMIYVAGLVNRPGQFELPADQNTHLVDAIALAGGRSSPIADKILIIRHIEGRKEPLAIQASLKKAKRNGNENLLLTAGDTVTVEQTPATAVVDTIYKFFRFSFGVAQRSSL